MAVSFIQPLSDATGRVDYVTLGRGEARAAHIEAGTTRPVAEICDLGSADEFAAFARSMARGAGRSREAYELRISWDDGELDPDNPDDCELAASLGYEACKRLYPDHPVLSIVHVDGEGRKVHVHNLIQNHNVRTGKAISGNTSHRRVSAVVDELMRERGLSVVGEKSAEWEAKRESVTGYERGLGDAVAEALAASASVGEFREELGKRGVMLEEVPLKRKNPDTGKRETVTGEDGKPVIAGWRYKSKDGETGRQRRRKASNLAAEFERGSVIAAFEARAAALREREAAEAARAARAATVAAVAAKPADPMALDRREATADLRALAEAARERRAERGGDEGETYALNRALSQVERGDGELFDRLEASARAHYGQQDGAAPEAKRRDDALEAAFRAVRDFLERVLMLMWRSRAAIAARERRAVTEAERAQAAREALARYEFAREHEQRVERYREDAKRAQDRELERVMNRVKSI